MIKYLILTLILNSLIFSQDDLSLKLEMGKDYIMYQHNEISIVQSINGTKIRMYTEIEAQNIYTVKEIKDSSYILDITMRDVMIAMSSPYFNIYYNSNDVDISTENFFVKMLSQLNDLRIQIEITPLGMITSTNFTEILSPIIYNLVSSVDAEISQENINDVVKQLNSMSPSKNLQRITNFLPQNKVSIGDKWITSDEIELGLPLSYQREIHYRSEMDSHIFLESKAVINTYDIQKSGNLGNNIGYQLDGTEIFNIQLSKDSRWFSKIEGETNVSGVSYQFNESDTLIIPININAKEYYGTVKY